MNRILIIEDDLVVRDELEKILSNQGYEVAKTSEFKNIDKIIKLEDFQLILLDINLPEANGFDICQMIKGIVKTPVIFVTSSFEQLDELKSILSGGDDFITKPYNLSILLEKIKRTIFKANPVNNKELIYHDVILDLHLSKIIFNYQEVELTRNEFLMMYYFFLHPEKNISKEELLEQLWNERDYLDENILSVNIKRLRNKLADVGLSDFIKTEYKRGYRI